MNKEDVLKTIEKHVVQSIGDVFDGESMDPQRQLLDYGANSLDMVEIVSGVMRELRVKIPRTELVDIQNIDGLAEKFLLHSAA